MSRFHLKAETDCSVRNVVSLIIDRTMDNVQKYDSYIVIVQVWKNECHVA
jgi:hypothetical protein